MKFRVDLEHHGQAHLRARIWPRKEPEPSGWTIEASGSAAQLGWFGRPVRQLDGATLYFDNVTVYRGDDFRRCERPTCDIRRRRRQGTKGVMYPAHSVCRPRILWHTECSGYITFFREVTESMGGKYIAGWAAAYGVLLDCGR